MRDDGLESRISDFEQAWRSGGPCDLAGYLDRPPELGAEERGRLLIELLCIDLEFRWRGRPEGRPSRERTLLEGYAARFPELGPLDRFPLEIIGQEYRVRCQWGDRPAHSDFLARFPARREPIRAELTRIDAELWEESAVPRGAPSRAGGPAAPEAEIGRDLGVPLLSHRDVLLRRMIGSGRTGKVYEARQRSTSRPVAVKFLRKSLLHQSEVVRRFVGEAGIVARLRHPNIVGVHGLGRTPAGAYFLVMELVAGPSLDHVVRAGPVPVEEAIRRAVEICDALEYAHANGIIHCDLKPANLLLDRGGGLRVADFGLARSLAGPNPWTAEIEGTAPYMAPEQASRSWGPFAMHTDVYGVGAVLFTLLTGRPPWMGRRLPDILADVISAAPVIPPTSLRPGLPEAISDVCRKCLSKAPEGRYRTVQQVRSALIEALGRSR